ncbi:DNA-binding protein [Roseateles aquatilis]|uniref:DNA-binding protein n=1 Tax=Roseateles aquatilis TaxID=431061 RepID=A0A246JKK2_9BURK|nr:DNA-binding protein [Roseateles aquatilis]OWQ93184.1 DNA-binding protein [Roseateles aquatilis]
MEFVFTLKYQMSVQDCEEESLIPRLGAAGCTDACITAGLRGRLMLTFSRRADRADAALLKALKDVRKALPGARLIEAGPDMVGLTDVADVVKVSRQNMRKLMLTHPTTFPSPMHEGNSSSVWHLIDVLIWMQSRGTYKIDQRVMDISAAAKAVNLVRECRHLDDRKRNELAQVMA